MKVGLYARVSTDDQNTLPMQIQALQKYVASRNWTVAVQVEDVGSGAKERPKRDELLKAARRREIDVIWESLFRHINYAISYSPGSRNKGLTMH